MSIGLLCIYLLGYIISAGIIIYDVLEDEGVLTIASLVFCILLSLGSWIMVLIALLLLFGDKPIYKKHKNHE